MAQDQPKPPLERFENLVRQAQEGSQAAMHDVMMLASDYLQGQKPGLMLKPDERASDYFQEAIVAAICKLPQFRGQTKAQFCCWLRAILRTTIQAHRRACGQRRTTLVDPFSPDGPLCRCSSAELTPEQALEQCEQAEQVRLCVRLLPEQYR